MGFGNIGDLMKIGQAWNQFKTNHPKFPAFLTAAKQMGIREDSIIGVEITSPDGEKIATNIKVQKSDLELLKTLMELQNGK